ncbi:hypothetical protein CEXT_178961 [Caerostris extrusa]|uniref:Uncharacterized protein n=1 Tax=Caerostris extrusa TaxID=172846 RepID=A0AAV4RXE8_CAEEX|nr:hypothetical protein CEXT_178961 [Caerostris extrusa]
MYTLSTPWRQAASTGNPGATPSMTFAGRHFHLRGCLTWRKVGCCRPHPQPIPHGLCRRPNRRLELALTASALTLRCSERPRIVLG